MDITRYHEPAAFLADATPFLLANEARHNLMLGLCADVAGNRSSYAEQLYFALICDEATPVAAAMMTPPHKLILSAIAHPGAVQTLAANLATFPAMPPGVQGEAADAEQLARLWTAARGGSHRVVVSERIFALTHVRPPAPAPGRVRVAQAADLPLVADWIDAFYREALPDSPLPDPQRSAQRWISGAHRTLYLWEDGGPVCMAGVSGPTPRGIRIGVVYTPPAHRRRGYACALVAAVSQQQLDAGRQMCFLYTDLANPTSNHIYQEIGYEPVADVIEVLFQS